MVKSWSTVGEILVKMAKSGSTVGQQVHSSVLPTQQPLPLKRLEEVKKKTARQGKWWLCQTASAKRETEPKTGMSKNMQKRMVPAGVKYTLLGGSMLISHQSALYRNKPSSRMANQRALSPPSCSKRLRRKTKLAHSDSPRYLSLSRIGILRLQDRRCCRHSMGRGFRQSSISTSL